MIFVWFVYRSFDWFLINKLRIWCKDECKNIDTYYDQRYVKVVDVGLPFLFNY